MLGDDVTDALTACFAALRISGAPAADEYPSEVLDFSDSPIAPDGSTPDGAMDLCVVVFVTDTGATSSSSAARKAAKAEAVAERVAQPDPLRTAIQRLRMPIGTDIDASNIVEARTRLDGDRQHLLDLTQSLATTERRLTSAQMEHDAAYGFMPGAIDPSRVADVRIRGDVIERAVGALPPIYETPVRNMRAAQVATVGMEQLVGEEPRERLKRVSDLLAAANAQQDRLIRLAKPAGSGSARVVRAGDDQHSTSSPPGEAHSDRTQTWRNPAPTTTGDLGDESPSEPHR